MDKFSELSKPKAFVVTGGKMYQDRAFMDKSTAERSKADRHDGAVVEPLYSQEYVSVLLARITELESTEIKPEGMRLMSKAIGAHGYIVGCLVQGRPDLALEESRKWVDAFSQAAELINNG